MSWGLDRFDEAKYIAKYVCGWCAFWSVVIYYLFFNVIAMIASFSYLPVCQVASVNINRRVN